jgi:hypothetical protein
MAVCADEHGNFRGLAPILSDVIGESFLINKTGKILLLLSRKPIGHHVMLLYN